MSTLTIAFDDTGATCVYDDMLADTMDELGDVVVTRASHVEPNPSGGWDADMSPITGRDGPVLGPYRLRSEALQAERDWLMEHRGI